IVLITHVFLDRFVTAEKCAAFVHKLAASPGSVASQNLRQPQPARGIMFGTETAAEQRCKGKILVVDDQPIFRDVFRAVLDGYHIDTVPTAEAAWERLVSTRHDLLLLDVCLPGVDGFEL